MIVQLRGTLIERDLEAVVVDVGGVGYAVMITAEAYKALPAVGADVRLFTYMHVIQDSAPQLFGFVDPDERRLFQALLAVQGVGPKVAVAILSGLPASELVRAIAGADVARLTQIRGVGRKIAERLTVELRDKIVALGIGGGGSMPAPAPRNVVPAGRLGEVHGALLALGYKPVEFEALLAKFDATEAVPDLIKQALAALREEMMARKRHDDGDAESGPAAADKLTGRPIIRPPYTPGAGSVRADDWPARDADANPHRVVTPERSREEDARDAALRPVSFAEFVGQRKVAENLAVYVAAATKRAGTLDHVLLSGPPGLGKTTLAHVIAHELGTEARVTSGPALERKGDLAGILTSLGRGDVLFIDEIHRLNPVIEESLYPAMEDFRIEIVTGAGAGASAITVPIERFTLVGATTRTGQLTSPLLSRFGIVERFDYYSPEELTTIVKRSARLLNITIEDAGATEIGRRARGTPRIVNRLLHRIRDFADVRGDGRITREAADYALSRLEIDQRGLDAGDRRLLLTMIQRYDGGPVGIDALAASLAEDRDTLEYVYEPYLIQEGFLIRTPRGRQATRLAYDHLKLPPPTKSSGAGGQGNLF